MRNFEDFQWEREEILLCDLKVGDVFRSPFGSVAFLIVARLPEATYLVRRVSYKASRRIMIMARDVKMSSSHVYSGVNFSQFVYKESKKYKIR